MERDPRAVQVIADEWGVSAAEVLAERQTFREAMLALRFAGADLAGEVRKSAPARFIYWLARLLGRSR